MATGLMAEAYRLHLLRGLEELLGQSGYPLVAGVDEAGRGSLAGPVAAGAVIVDPRRLVPGVDDSKNLTAGERQALAGAIEATSHDSAVAFVSAAEIDQINVLEATRRAMRQALDSLRLKPDCVVVDAVPLKGLDQPCLPVVRGDRLSYAVACASILAKVARDRLMRGYHAEYPQYGFASNKGYGAREHRRALREFGPCPIHRLTFGSVLPRSNQREISEVQA
jgi:ribonuclease HII